MGRPFEVMGSPIVAAKLTGEKAGAAANGIFTVIDGLVGHSPASKKFAEQFRAEYGVDPDALFSYTFDAAHILAMAMKFEKSRSGEKIRDAIAHVKGYEGVYGAVAFDAEGNGVHHADVVKLKDQKPVFIKTINED